MDGKSGGIDGGQLGAFGTKKSGGGGIYWLIIIGIKKGGKKLFWPRQRALPANWDLILIGKGGKGGWMHIGNRWTGLRAKMGEGECGIPRGIGIELRDIWRRQQVGQKWRRLANQKELGRMANIAQNILFDGIQFCQFI